MMSRGSPAPSGLLLPFLNGDLPLAPQSAAARLAGRMSVDPLQGGRLLALSFSAATPRLAGDVVRAYLEAFAALQGGRATLRLNRRRRPCRGWWSMTSRHPPAATCPRCPSCWWQVAARLILTALTLLARASAPSATPRAAQSVPAAPESARRVAWLDGGRGASLSCRRAARLLSEQLGTARRDPDHQLVVVTSDLPSETPATFAITLARHLSEESRVALVALGRRVRRIVRTDLRPLGAGHGGDAVRGGRLSARPFIATRCRAPM